MLIPILLAFLLPVPIMPTDNPIVYTSPVVMQDISISPSYIENTLIPFYSSLYDIDEKSFAATLKCESNFAAKAIGDHGTSMGVAQIHLPAHPDISKDDALNPFFSIDWAAKQFAKGNQKIWSCYNMLAINSE